MMLTATSTPRAIHNLPATATLYRHESGALCARWADGERTYEAAITPTQTEGEYQRGEAVRCDVAERAEDEVNDDDERQECGMIITGRGALLTAVVERCKIAELKAQGLLAPCVCCRTEVQTEPGRSYLPGLLCRPCREQAEVCS